MSDGPMLPVVSHKLPAPNEPDAAVETLLAELKADGIARVEWTIYWYADQTELQSMALFAADGTHQQTLYDGELLTAWDEALWHLTDMVTRKPRLGPSSLWSPSAR